jgi:ABC-type amino acid transport system permease subunit
VWAAMMAMATTSHAPIPELLHLAEALRPLIWTGFMIAVLRQQISPTQLVFGASLAIVIGYQDLFSVSNTSINQTGQAIEVIFIMMTVYLVLSLLTAAGMNIYNARVALKER